MESAACVCRLRSCNTSATQRGRFYLLNGCYNTCEGIPRVHLSESCSQTDFVQLVQPRLTGWRRSESSSVCENKSAVAASVRDKRTVDKKTLQSKSIAAGRGLPARAARMDGG
jgi:hypothetical protein